MKKRYFPIIAFLTILVLTSLACSLFTKATPTAVEVLPTEAEAVDTPTLEPTDDDKSVTEPPEDSSSDEDESVEEPDDESVEEPDETDETDSDQDADLGDEYRSDEGGYAFQQIPGWDVDEDYGMTIMLAPGADDDHGPMVAFIGELSDEEMSLDDVYDDFVSEVGEDGEVSIGDPIDLKVSGIPALRVDVWGVEDDVDLKGSLVVGLVTPHQVFVMIGVAPADVWDSETSAYFDAIMDTMTFFEPETTIESDDLEDEDDNAGDEDEADDKDSADDSDSDSPHLQWAVEAEASSEYGNDSWSASQAVGEPDTLLCGDYKTAWATEDSDAVETLDLFYETPVVPVQLDIYQTYNPSQVVKVEVFDPTGDQSSVVYDEEPVETDECPYVLTIKIDDVNFPVERVQITIDQSELSLGWNEIDAVSLMSSSGPVMPDGDDEEEDDDDDDGDDKSDTESFDGLPIFEGAENISSEKGTITYSVNDVTMPDVRDFYIDELAKIGWVLDIDEDGKCVKGGSLCTGALLELDYYDSENVIWYFVREDDGDESILLITISEAFGVAFVALTVVEY